MMEHALLRQRPTPAEWRLAREIKRALMDECGLTPEQGHIAMNIALLELVRFNDATKEGP
jgi:hypothetical protein